MDETIRVKIVADTTQINSSLKQVNKDTQSLAAGGNTANAAISQLNKTLNSIGFKTLPISNLINAFSNLKTKTKEVSEVVDKNLTKNIENRFGNMNFRLRGIGMSFNHELGTIYKNLTNNVNVTQNHVLELKKHFYDFTNLMAKVDEKSPFSATNKQVIQLRKELDKLAVFADYGTEKQFKKILNNFSTRWVEQMGKPRNKLVGFFQAISTGAGRAAKMIGELGEKIINLGAKILKAGFIVTLISALALIKNAFSVSKLGDEIDKTSQKVGMTTAAFQKWSYVLERFDIDVSNLKTAMRQLNQAAMGDNASYFSAIGVNPQNLSQQQLFEETVKGLQKISDSTERARLAYKLFGRSSSELAPLLNSTSEEVSRLTYQYDLLGAVMDGRTVRASANMQDAIQDLKAAWQGLKNTLAQAIIPIITQVIVRITVLVAKLNMILKTVFGIEIEYTNFEDTTAAALDNVESTNTAVKKLKTLIAGFDELNIFPSQDSGSGNGGIGGWYDEYGDWGGYSTASPITGDILPESAIKELEDFRDHLDEIALKWDKIKTAYENVKRSFSLDPEFEPTTWYERVARDVGTITEGWWDWLQLPDIDWDTYSITQFFEDIKTELESPLQGGWFADVLNWGSGAWLENLFGDINLDNGLFSLEAMFGEDMAKVIRGEKSFGEHFKEESWLGQFIDFYATIFKGIGVLPDVIQELYDSGELFKTDDSTSLFELIMVLYKELPGYFEKLYEQNPNIQSLVDTINDLWKAIGGDAIVQSIKESPVIKAFQDFNEDLKGVFGDAFKPLGDAWDRFWSIIIGDTDDYCEEVVEGVEDGLDDLPDAAGSAWDDIKRWWRRNISPYFQSSWWEQQTEQIIDGMKGADVPGETMSIWQKMWNGAVDLWNDLFNEDTWENEANEINEGLEAADIPEETGSIFENMFQKGKDLWNSLFNPTAWKNETEHIAQGMEQADVPGRTNKTIWEKITSAIGTIKEKLFNKDDWKKNTEKINQGMKEAEIGNDLGNRLTQMMKSITSGEVFTKNYWKKIFKVIPDGMADVDVTTGSESTASKIAQALQNKINSFIDTFNASSMKTALEKLGIKLTLPKLKFFAGGGIIDKPTLGLMGEYPGASSNPEIVTPENKLTEIFENSNNDIVDVLIQGFRQIVTAIDQKDTSVSVDGMTLAKSVQKANNNYRVMTGTSLF